MLKHRTAEARQEKNNDRPPLPAAMSVEEIDACFIVRDAKWAGARLRLFRGGARPTMSGSSNVVFFSGERIDPIMVRDLGEGSTDEMVLGFLRAEIELAAIWLRLRQDA